MLRDTGKKADQFFPLFVRLKVEVGKEEILVGMGRNVRRGDRLCRLKDRTYRGIDHMIV